jgi:hypothetical protein
MQDFISTRGTETNTTLVADAFAVICKSFPFNRPAATCDAIGAFLRLRPNAGKRAGILCGLLESCGPSVGASCSISAGGLSGALEMCTLEGIAGGQLLPGVLNSTQGKGPVAKKNER